MWVVSYSLACTKGLGGDPVFCAIVNTFEPAPNAVRFAIVFDGKDDSLNNDTPGKVLANISGVTGVAIRVQPDRTFIRVDCPARICLDMLCVSGPACPVAFETPWQACPRR